MRLRVVIFAVLFVFLGSRSALCSIPARVIALDASTIAWGAGGSQLINSTWKAGNVLKTFRSSFSPASLGYVVASVAASWVVENYGNQAVGEIRSYLNQAGFNYANGQWTQTSSTPSTQFEPGTAVANDYAAWVGSGHILEGTTVGMDSASVIREGEGQCSQYYQTVCSGQSGCGKSASTGLSYGTVRFWLIHMCNGAGGLCTDGHSFWNTCAYSVSGGQTQNFYPPLPVGAAEIKTKTEQDLTSGVPAAQAAVTQAEKVIDKALAGQPWIDISQNPPVAVPTGGVLDRPAPDLPSTVNTPRKAVEVPAAAAIGQPLEDMGVAADSAPGEITPATPVPDTIPYNDPALSGTHATEAWPEVGNLTSQWQSFKTSMAQTGIFTLGQGFFNNVPSGGGSSYSFSAGVFGNHTFDFATAFPAIVWSILSSVTFAVCSYVAIRIVILKH